MSLQQALRHLSLGQLCFLRLSVISLISSLAYVWLAHFLLSRIGKSDKFLAFIIPYQWLTALQAVLFGGIAVVVMAAPQLQLHLAVIPIVIWFDFPHLAFGT